MTPLDLSVAPPRRPRADVDGILFLPRSIDKVRASLSGGDLGEYTIAGFTQMMLDMFAIPLQAFTAAVAEANGDADIAVFVRKHANQAKIDEWNAFVSKREPRAGNRKEALEVYAWLKERPDLILALDVLEEDDRQHFSRSR